MDLPSQRAMIQGRIDNLKESQENYENGKIDSYSRRYASIMGGYLNTNQASKPMEKENKESKNLRTLMNSNK
jgi:delta-aminolevulinic acid dehydratase/porphobilinogen synthase